MSDTAFVFTDVLPLAEAKELLRFLQKPGKAGKWKDWSGEGGFETEVELNGLTARKLGDVVLPDYVSSMFVQLSGIGKIGEGEIPESLFIGGDDWIPPIFDSKSDVRCSIFVPRLNIPMTLTYEKNSNMRFSGRSFNTNDGFGLSRNTVESVRDLFPSGSDISEVDQWVSDTVSRFNIPRENSVGFFEGKVDKGYGFFYRYDPEKQKWVSNHFREVLDALLAESGLGYFVLGGVVDIGGNSGFHGESRNVRPEAQALLERIPQKNPGMIFDLEYHVVGPQDWRGREKSRKKWKRPIYQNLGAATLENGAVADVSLRIEKEGYAFTVNFRSDDDLMRFPQTRVFQKVKWNSGAE